MAKIAQDGKMSGQVRILRTDYDAYHFRVENAAKTQDNYLEKFEAELGNLSISNYKIENQKSNIKDPILETFSFTSGSQSDIIGGKIFVSPLLFFTRTKNPFNQEQRVMPVYFGYKNQQKYNVNIEIPEGFQVESLPQPIRIATEDKNIIYLLNFSAEGNKIQITCSKEINSSIFAAEQYAGLKNMFQKVIASQNEKIVLKKI